MIESPRSDAEQEGVITMDYIITGLHYGMMAGAAIVSCLVILSLVGLVIYTLARVIDYALPEDENKPDEDADYEKVNKNGD